MSRTTKLKRARRLLAAADAVIDQLRHEMVCEILRRDDRIAVLYRQLDQLDQKVRPCVERIMAVQYETKWYYPILPTEEHVSYFLRAATDADADFAMPVSRTGVLDTHRRLMITFAVADEVLVHMLKEAPDGIVDDYFIDVGAKLAAKAVNTIQAAQGSGRTTQQEVAGVQ